MSLLFKKIIVAVFAVAFVAAVIFVGLIERERAKPEKAAVAYSDETTRACIDCHEEKGIAVDWNRQWAQSRHAEMGIGCIACHEAKPDDPDKWEHEGSLLTHAPSPNDCAACHETIVKEFAQSHHAKAAQFIGSLDNILGEVAEGGPAANLGCRQCHGSQLAVDDKGVPVAGTWPNTGIGRVNPDGSLGSCTACHTRHTFSKQQAREPRTCGRCHMGPDHPQIEIYEESKHGIMFAAFREKMALDSDVWIVGKEYTAAPTCATCHMSATSNLPVNHDVGLRISWTLRPLYSKKQENWEERRNRMDSVCLQCHAKTWVSNYYQMYDDAVDLWNTKFAAPADKILESLKSAGKITPTPFDDPIEWTFYELWHHEGRRARMGASMMGPDFTQWHGFYEVAKHFYNKYLPEAEDLLPGVTDSALQMPEHAWKQGMTPEQIRKMLEFYQQRYGQKVQ
ncbi:MAG TPA: multiheme c-type cytochrome [bacterium]|nr:multiheme c-type cytochrome [bacterium]